MTPDHPVTEPFERVFVPKEDLDAAQAEVARLREALDDWHTAWSTGTTRQRAKADWWLHTFLLLAQIDPVTPAKPPKQPQATDAMLRRIHGASKLLGLNVADAIHCALVDDVLEEELTFAQCQKVNDWLIAAAPPGDTDGT